MRLTTKVLNNARKQLEVYVYCFEITTFYFYVVPFTKTFRYVKLKAVNY